MPESSKVKVNATLKGPKPSKAPATPAKIIDPSSESPSSESPETNKTSETVTACNVSQLQVEKAKQFLNDIGARVGGKHRWADATDQNFKKQKTTGGVALGINNCDPLSKKVSSVTSKISAPCHKSKLKPSSVPRTGSKTGSKTHATPSCKTHATSSRTHMAATSARRKVVQIEMPNDLVRHNEVPSLLNIDCDSESESDDSDDSDDEHQDPRSEHKKEARYWISNETPTAQENEILQRDLCKMTNEIERLTKRLELQHKAFTSRVTRDKEENCQLRESNQRMVEALGACGEEEPGARKADTVRQVQDWMRMVLWKEHKFIENRDKLVRYMDNDIESHFDFVDADDKAAFIRTYQNDVKDKLGMLKSYAQSGLKMAVDCKLNDCGVPS